MSSHSRVTQRKEEGGKISPVYCQQRQMKYHFPAKKSTSPGSTRRLPDTHEPQVGAPVSLLKLRRQSETDLSLTKHDPGRVPPASIPCSWSGRLVRGWGVGQGSGLPHQEPERSFLPAEGACSCAANSPSFTQLQKPHWYLLPPSMNCMKGHM